MRPLLQQASRLVLKEPGRALQKHCTKRVFGSLAEPWTTAARGQKITGFQQPDDRNSILSKSRIFARAFSYTPKNSERSLDGRPQTRQDRGPGDVSIEEPPVSQQNALPSTSDNPSTSADKDTIRRVPDEDLPSYRDEQRWTLSKRFSRLMDDLLPKLAVVSQQVNNYTGTDYSGIAALRKEIKEQEQLVKSRRVAVEQAKQALEAAHAQQAASNKEVVGLLERKSSWSAADLERYMALIRSEHLNEQAVNAAKERVAEAEQALEEARTLLEKRERAQYHEEQIWSDTIRRNSTWVTFGLMGVNIMLLLVNLVIIEPWRRRRLVREIRSALDEQKISQSSLVSALRSPAEVEADAVIEPAQPAQPAGPAGPAEPSPQSSDNILPTTEQPPKREIEDSLTTGVMEVDDTKILEERASSLPLVDEADVPPTSSDGTSWQSYFEQYKRSFRDLFSERNISIRKVDLTAAALEGMAAGAAMMGLLLVLLKRN